MQNNSNCAQENELVLSTSSAKFPGSFLGRIYHRNKERGGKKVLLCVPFLICQHKFKEVRENHVINQDYKNNDNRNLKKTFEIV